MIGEQLLKKLFPDFEELIQPAGIDLRVDKVYRQMGPGSLIDDERNLPPLEMLEPPIYRLEPGKAYLASVDRMIEIPEGYAMLYLPRSTLLRSFVSVQTAVGDPGFRGTLQFLLHNHGEYEYTLKRGERIVQAVVFPVEGSGKYSGSYQE